MTLSQQRHFVLNVLALFGAICAMCAGCATVPKPTTTKAKSIPADGSFGALFIPQGAMYDLPPMPQQMPEAILLPDLTVALTITPLVITNSPIRSNTSSISMEKCSPSCVLLTIHCDEGATPMLQDSHDLLSWSSWYFVSNNLQFVSETGNSNRFIRLKNQ